MKKMEFQIDDVNVQKGHTVDFLNARVSINCEIIVGWTYDKKNKDKVLMSNSTFHAVLKKVQLEMRKTCEILARKKLEAIEHRLRDPHPDWSEEEIRHAAMKELGKRFE
jgi:hypothetical protein